METCNPNLVLDYWRAGCPPLEDDVDAYYSPAGNSVLYGWHYTLYNLPLSVTSSNISRTVDVVYDSLNLVLLANLASNVH